MLIVLNAYHATRMFVYIADKIIEQKDYLTEVDNAIGDGDHGIGMTGGMKKVIAKMDNHEEYSNTYDIFNVAGKAMMMSMGGASGIFFGKLFSAGAVDARPKEDLTAYDLAQILRKGLDDIKKRGKAEIGDKTLVDALEPAVKAMEENIGAGLLLVPMLVAAEEAAKQGVEDSKKYMAKFGRAKPLKERAIGFPDPGAISVYLIIQGMREYAQNSN